jgi:hypothetical protein
VFISSREPVITSIATTRSVIAPITPGGPNGSRRQGPASAIAAMITVQAVASR